jgi:tetratricopeptide (TPR) repeat protein
VQQFEVSPELSGSPPISGKSASDVFVDALNVSVNRGSQFHGAEYYAYDVDGAQSIGLKRLIKVPVQTSYGIELKRISIDNLIRAYNFVRYQQWFVSGNFVTSGDQITLMVRLEGDGAPKSWEVARPARSDPAEFVRSVCDSMLSEVDPEISGRAYLEQGNYQRAEEIFRQWTIHSPGKWKPPYYLSLAYDYQGKKQEALFLADWSRDIAAGEKDLTRRWWAGDSGGGTPSAKNLAKLSQAVSQMGVVPITSEVSQQEAVGRLKQLKGPELRPKELLDNDPANANYRIQLARTLDKEAAIESGMFSGPSIAFDTEKRAVALMDDAVKRLPQNGGLYEQRSILLQRLAFLARAKPGGIPVRKIWRKRK